MSQAASLSPIKYQQQQTPAIDPHEEFQEAIHVAASKEETTFHYTHKYEVRRIPNDIKVLRPFVQVLHIDNCYELKDIPPSIGDLTGLRWLNLSYNRIETLPSEIGKLRKLERLHLNNNVLSALPREIWELRQLQELRCESNKLRALPTGVLFLPNLRELAMENNPLLDPTDVEGVEPAEVFPPPPHGGCANCHIWISSAECITFITFHAIPQLTHAAKTGALIKEGAAVAKEKNTSKLPYVHFVCSEKCEGHLRRRFQDAGLD